MTSWDQTGEGQRARDAWAQLVNLYAGHLMRHLSYLGTLANRSIRG